ncbi:MAG: L,D-transpeptidase [Clostridia bacterium]|nr:L,D-transpeptidase [Clostridia bacterium]MBR5044199.1 L,D-transpeptidase [Clostridia bacterium]
MRKITALLLLLSLLPTLSACKRSPDPGASAPPTTEATESPATEPALPPEAEKKPQDVAALFPPFVQPGLLLLTGGGSVPVELISAESDVSYRIRYPSGSEATVGWDKIAPLAPDPPLLPDPTSDETLVFLGGKLGEPLPAWVLFVDLSRLTVTAVKNGEVIRVMPCSAGDAGHPTPRGRYETDYKTEFMGKEGVYLCRWGVHYHGGYLLHSVLYTWRGDEILDGELSARISHGCVRLSPEDSRWIYETAPLGAVVLVN